MGFTIEASGAQSAVRDILHAVTPGDTCAAHSGVKKVCIAEWMEAFRSMGPAESPWHLLSVPSLEVLSLSGLLESLYSPEHLEVLEERIRAHAARGYAALSALELAHHHVPAGQRTRVSDGISRIAQFMAEVSPTTRIVVRGVPQNFMPPLPEGARIEHFV